MDVAYDEVSATRVVKNTSCTSRATLYHLFSVFLRKKRRKKIQISFTGR
jgi:hypothetical protein